MINPKLNIHRLHKWMGLTAALWLAVLGLSGFLLDHRDNWQWLWQTGIPQAWVNDRVVEKSKTSQIRLYQINPENPQNHLAGGFTGLWWSSNSGVTWQATKFIAAEDKVPMISAILISKKNTVWIASNNGLWLSGDGGKSAEQMALQGQWISALSLNANINSVTGVIDRTKIFNFSSDNRQVTLIHINTIKPESLPDAIELSRFARDIHYGRGVFSIPVSLLWNDITAIAMVILPLTGFIFYWLPKKWRRDKILNIKRSHKVKKQLMRWLFRMHAPTFGFIAAVPLLYLSLSGILLDHATELRDWMKSVQVTRSWQTPVYNLDSWEGEIYAIDTDPVNPLKFSLGTRLGLFTTQDKGQHWLREKMLANKAVFIWSLRRHEKTVFVGAMGGPNMVTSDEKTWRPVKGVGHMPSDITVDSDKNWVWKSRHGLMSGNTSSGFTPKQINLPLTQFVPWFYLIDGLHSGVLIHSQWKWINDFIALLAVLLVITGLMRWWHKKWI